MKNGRFDVFLFDLGRVLLDFDHRIAANKIAVLCDKDPQWLAELFFDSELVQSFGAGRITPREFYDTVKRLTGMNISYEEFALVWSDIFSEKPEMEQLVKRLKKDYKVDMISNIDKLHYEFIAGNFSIIDLMGAKTLSYEVGALKPDPKIYRAAIDASGAAPERIIYMDDRPELAEGGRKAGLNSFTFSDIKGLAADLKSINIDLKRYIPGGAS